MSGPTVAQVRRVHGGSGRQDHPGRRTVPRGAVGPAAGAALGTSQPPARLSESTRATMSRGAVGGAPVRTMPRGGAAMSDEVLVAYATRHESTRGIAAAIADVLAAAGLKVRLDHSRGSYLPYGPGSSVQLSTAGGMGGQPSAASSASETMRGCCAPSGASPSERSVEGSCCGDRAARPVTVGPLEDRTRSSRGRPARPRQALPVQLHRAPRPGGGRPLGPTGGPGARRSRGEENLIAPPPALRADGASFGHHARRPPPRSRLA